MEITHIPGIERPVARIGLGTWQMGGWMWGGADEKEAIATIHQALDRGIHLIDTAPIYGFGTCEKLVGKALVGRRDEAVIATKCGLRFDQTGITKDSTPKRIQEEIERSLVDLNIDQIDLYQVHWPDETTPFEETAKVLEELKKQGKIAAVGVSNFTPKMMEAFGSLAISLQSPFNLFEKDIAVEEIPYCHRHKMVVLGYSSLCRGLLSGKLTPNSTFPEDDQRHHIDPKFSPPLFKAYLACVEKLKEWAYDHYNKQIGALAVRFALDSGVDIALWGARFPHQLDLMDEVWGWQLTKKDFDEIETILEMIPNPSGPYFASKTGE